MRLISQDGDIDIPYDLASLEIMHMADGKYSIYAKVQGSVYFMAYYYTREEAQEVLARLRNRYFRNDKALNGSDYFIFK